MKTYQGNATYKFEAYTIYSKADHLQAYREEYPTRRRQLNAANKDIDNMRDAIEGIQARLNDGRTYTHYMGDQYNAGDLADMRQDLANLEEARDIIDATPCPAKVAKEMDKAREEAQATAAPAAPVAKAANEPQKVTIELPAGFSVWDLHTLIMLASRETHRQRMEAAREPVNFDTDPEGWAANLDKCNFLSDLYNGANKISDQLHPIAWDAPGIVEEYHNTNKFVNRYN
jgi:hypothetical protein